MPQAAPVADLREVHAAFVSRFNAGDLDGLVALYEPDATVIPSPGAPMRGHEAIRSALQGFLALGGKMSISSTVAYEGPGGIGLTHGEWALRGGQTELAGKTAEVLRRQPDGRWLYVIDNPWA